MSHEAIAFQDAPRHVKLAIKRDLAERALGIVRAADPQPVLGAEIEAQITEATPFVDAAAGEALDKRVVIDSAVAFGIGLAVSKKSIVVGMRGNQLEYRLPNDPVEAGHVTE